MSDHSHAAHPPPTQVETPEAFLADRMRFWEGFTSFTLWSVIAVIILLVLMAVFLCSDCLSPQFLAPLTPFRG